MAKFNIDDIVYNESFVVKITAIFGMSYRYRILKSKRPIAERNRVETLPIDYMDKRYKKMEGKLVKEFYE